MWLKNLYSLQNHSIGQQDKNVKCQSIFQFYCNNNNQSQNLFDKEASINDPFNDKYEDFEDFGPNLKICHEFQNKIHSCRKYWNDISLLNNFNCSCSQKRWQPFHLGLNHIDWSFSTVIVLKWLVKSLVLSENEHHTIDVKIWNRPSRLQFED